MQKIFKHKKMLNYFLYIYTGILKNFYSLNCLLNKIKDDITVS